jgi:hypothetical protein
VAGIDRTGATRQRCCPRSSRCLLAHLILSSDYAVKILSSDYAVKLIAAPRRSVFDAIGPLRDVGVLRALTDG